MDLIPQYFGMKLQFGYNKTNLTLTRLRIVDVGITLFGISQHLGNRPLKLQ